MQSGLDVLVSGEKNMFWMNEKYLHPKYLRAKNMYICTLNDTLFWCVFFFPVFFSNGLKLTALHENAFLKEKWSPNNEQAMNRMNHPREKSG